MSREGDGREVVFLSVKDVAARYNRTRYWVYHCKALNPYRRKIGKYLMFLEDDLREFERPKALLEILESNTDRSDIAVEYEKREKRLEVSFGTNWKFDML